MVPKVSPVDIRSVVAFRFDWPTAAAALILSLLPLLIVVVAFQRLRYRFTLGTEAAATQAPDR